MASPTEDGCIGEIDLPVVDLSALNPSDLLADNSSIPSTALLELISKIRDACLDTGFFHVINHGFDEEAIKKVDSASREIFDVPSDAKEKPVLMNDWYDYTRRVEPSYFESVNLKKVLVSDSTQRISDLFWPDGNPKFCNAIQEYSAKMEAFSKTLIKLIVLSLGFEKSSEYYESFFEKSTESTLRLSSYVPPAARKPKSVVLGSHTDFSFITILYHDAAGGLEVQNTKGDWLRVKRVPNLGSTSTSFVVDLGDAFEMWSNSRYVSTPHRVVDAGWSSRLNVAFFVACKDDTEMYAPEQLIDEEHPRRYVPFVFKEYNDYKYELMLSLQKEIEIENVSPFLVRSKTPTAIASN